MSITAPNTLRPLPLRITQRQYDRLVARRAFDQLSIQEHVRRALDVYLDGLGDPPAPQRKRKASPAPEPSAPAGAPDAETPAAAEASRPKMVMR